MTSSSWRTGAAIHLYAGVCGRERSKVNLAGNVLVSNIKQTTTRQAKYVLVTLAHMVASVLGYIPVYEASDFGKEGAGTMAVARPEPLFDWFIPIDGDGVHLGT